MDTRYRVYSKYLEKKFDAKVYKVSINLPGTCPNRDGTVGLGGCVFCDESGSGFECLSNTLAIEKQMKENKAFYKKRFNATKFIAYFQAFTNTYMSLEDFQENILSVVKDPEIVGISISTRPDCINDRYLDFLQEIQQQKGLDINIELGLQTVNYHTLNSVNRGHTLAEFIDAQLRIKKRGLETVAHIILNLPGDEMLDVIENAKIISALEVDHVKIHSLYVVMGTKLGDMYEDESLTLITLDEYIERVVTFLEYLSPNIVIQRLVGKGPQKYLHFCNWNTSWWKIKEQIEDLLIAQDTYQGKKCTYLNGGALKGKNLI